MCIHAVPWHAVSWHCSCAYPEFMQIHLEFIIVTLSMKIVGDVS